MKGHAVIISKAVEDIGHKLKIINPNYTVLINAEIMADDDSCYEKAHIVYPPYNDEVRFIGAICRFASFYDMTCFFYIDSTGDKWKVDSNGNMTAYPELVLNEEKCEIMGHIPAMAYGYLLYRKYPELIGIRDVESAQKNLNDIDRKI